MWVELAETGANTHKLCLCVNCKRHIQFAMNWKWHMQLTTTSLITCPNKCETESSKMILGSANKTKPRESKIILNGFLFVCSLLFTSSIQVAHTSHLTLISLYKSHTSLWWPTMKNVRNSGIALHVHFNCMWLCVKCSIHFTMLYMWPGIFLWTMNLRLWIWTFF